MAKPDFSLVWAENSPLSPYTFSDANYLTGWNFIGPVPPDRRMFDAWFKRTDLKMKWLDENSFYLLRENSTVYHVNDIAFSTNLPSNLYLVCTSAGTSASTEPSWTGAAEGGNVTDGTVTWQYRSLSTKYAPINSPTFTGTPKAPTPAAGDDSTNIATTAFVKAAAGSGGYNTRDIVTSSGTYTAPVSGWYKITVKGGGGGGQGGYKSSIVGRGGSGGGEGGTTIVYKKMAASDTVTVIIGAGGAGGSASAGEGSDGGNSTVTIGGTIYTGGGGGGGGGGYIGYGGIGGTGTIPGAPGGVQTSETSGSRGGSSGGGAGGGVGKSTNSVPEKATSGGGGAGGGAQYNSYQTKGGDGGDGFVWFEYYNGSL